MIMPPLGHPRTGWNTTVDIPEGQEGISILDMRMKGLVEFRDGQLPIITSNAELLEQLREFAKTARLDVTSRWWHHLLTPWGRRRWLARK
ncbi:hypothetical protein [Streptomyces sp. NPDC058579]|uniref:hypothetical protein n=1 Tax=Streptomyces sp. NPDC058579 TaxID=3346548 RepID=UPI003653578E